MLFGERNLKYSGTMQFRDQANGLAVDVEVDPDFEASYSAKGIMGWALGGGKSGAGPDAVRGDLLRDGVVVDTVRGTWLSEVAWERGQGAGGGRARGVYWDRAVDLPLHQRPTPKPDPLPSDSRFRQDLVALGSGDIDGAQTWKEKLENLQRGDAKLRKKGAKEAKGGSKGGA